MGHQEGFLHPIPKGDIPLSTYHIDYLGTLATTRKQYRYILCVIDGFSKFLWIYPTKTTSAKELIEKLEIQKAVFGNPKYIIADRGGSFRSTEFSDYCRQQEIALSLTTTGVATGNGQVERIFRIVIPALSKLAVNNPDEWYKYTYDLQRFLNNSFQRSIGMAPFNLLIGTNMRCQEDVKLKDIIKEQVARLFVDERQVLRDEARVNISILQNENKRNFNKKRKPSTLYEVGDFVLIRRTQFNSGAKLDPKYLGPYEIIKVKPCDRYEVQKVTQGEGPIRTSTSAENMKPYYVGMTDDDFEGEDEDDGYDDRVANAHN